MAMNAEDIKKLLNKNIKKSKKMQEKTNKNQDEVVIRLILEQFESVKEVILSIKEKGWEIVDIATMNDLSELLAVLDRTITGINDEEKKERLMRTLEKYQREVYELRNRGIKKPRLF